MWVRISKVTHSYFLLFFLPFRFDNLELTDYYKEILDSMLDILKVQQGERFSGEGMKFNCAHDIPEPEAIRFASDNKILPIFVKSGQKKYVSGAIDWLNKQTRRNFKFMFYPLDYLFQQLVSYSIAIVCLFYDMA